MRRFWMTVTLVLSLLLGVILHHLGIQADQEVQHWRDTDQLVRALDGAITQRIIQIEYVKWLEWENEEMRTELRMRGIKTPEERKRKI